MSEVSAPTLDAGAIAATLDVYDLSRGDAAAIVASLILLRWLDLADAQAADEAIFEDRAHQPLFPPALQWRNWCTADRAEMAERLAEVCRVAQSRSSGAGEGPAAHVSLLAEPLRQLLELKPIQLVDAVHLVAALRMETSSELLETLTFFDELLANLSTPYDAEASTPPSVTRLIVALADPQPGESVFDPCFGRAGFLLNAWRHAESGRSRRPHRPGPLLDLAGVEINARTFLIGLTRLVLSGAWSARLHLGDSLERDNTQSPMGQGFDVILANPPIGAKTRREKWRYQQFSFLTPDLTGLFVQQVLAQLKPHGRAIVAVPNGFLFRSGSERDLRRWLIEQGYVDAVVGLPAGVFLPYTGVKGSLLLLRKVGRGRHIRMVDATYFFEVARGKRPALPDAMAKQLAQLVREIDLPKLDVARGSPDDSLTPGTGRISRSVWDISPQDLEVFDWDLTPRRREKGSLTDRLGALVGGIRGAIPIVTLTEVAQVMGGASIRSADLTDVPRDASVVPYLRIKDISKGMAARATSWVSSAHPRSMQPGARLLPADVLLSKSGTIGKTAVVRNGAVGAIASSGLYVIRADRERLDPSFLVAYLSSAACQEWLAAQRRGSVIQHLNRDVLDRLPVPLPPMPLQLRAAEQFQDVGIDVLDFLVKALGGDDADQLTVQLSKLLQLIPGADSPNWPPPLSLLRPIADVIRKARNAWAHSAHGSQQETRWLSHLAEVVRPLEHAVDMPRGPSLLSVVSEAERGFETVLEGIHEQMPSESQAATLVQLLRDWMLVTSIELLAEVRIKVTADIAQLIAGEEAEIPLSVTNGGALPLSAFQIVSAPEWGSTEASYFQEGTSIPLTLRGSVPKGPGLFSVTLAWRGVSLDGIDYAGEVQVSFEVILDKSTSPQSEIDLGASPYVTGSPLDPIEGSDVFFGREEILKQIARQVTAQGNVILLEGNRRAGKTSILRHLEGSRAIPGWLAVYASLQGAEGAKNVVGIPTEAVFHEIAGCIAVAVNKLGGETPLPDGTVIRAGGRPLGIGRACRAGISVDTPFADFREYLDLILELLADRKLSLLLMLDEFDKIQEGITHGVTSPQVPENIRFLIQTYPRFSAILTGSRRLKRLREEYWSALYGLGTSIQVTALDANDARRVIIEPVRARLTYSPEAVDRVLALTARQPYLLQCLCNRVFDFAAATRARSITTTSIDEAAASLVKDNEHFASLWDYAAQGSPIGRLRRQYILLLLAEAFSRTVDVDFGGLQETLTQQGVEISDEALAVDLDYLRELDLVEFIIEVGTGRYRLAIPLMATWIEQQHDHEVVQRRAIAEAEEEVG